MNLVVYAVNVIVNVVVLLLKCKKVPGDFQGDAGSAPEQPNLAVVSLFIAGELG